LFFIDISLAATTYVSEKMADTVGRRTVTHHRPFVVKMLVLY